MTRGRRRDRPRPRRAGQHARRGQGAAPRRRPGRVGTSHGRSERSRRPLTARRPRSRPRGGLDRCPPGALPARAPFARRPATEGDRLGVASLPPVQRGLVIGDVEAAGTPILLVHGMVDNRSIFTLLRRGLRRRGFGRVIALNYSPLDRRRTRRRRPARRPRRAGLRRDRLRAHPRRRATPWAAWCPATTSSGWVATPACTRWSRSAPRTAGRSRHGCSRTRSCASCGRAATSWPSSPRPPRLPHPVRGHLVRPRPDGGAQAFGDHRPPGPERAQRVRPRGRAHVAAGRRSGRARDLHDAWRTSTTRVRPSSWE